MASGVDVPAVTPTVPALTNHSDRKSAAVCTKWTRGQNMLHVAASSRVLLLPAPPDVFVIPGTYAYFPPAVDIDIIFYGGYWYRPHRGYWYRSSSYNGKWAYVEIERLPRGIRTLPPDWRSVPPGHRHIPYGHMKKSWRTWERDKYWEKHEWKHEEKERHREYKEHRKQEKHKYKGKKYDD